MSQQRQMECEEDARPVSTTAVAPGLARCCAYSLLPLLHAMPGPSPSPICSLQVSSGQVLQVLQVWAG